MARRERPARTRASDVMKGLRPMVGGLVLVATVRTIDALWRRVTRQQPPSGRGPADADERARATPPPTDPAAIRDRFAYATLLGAAQRLAERAGLPKDR